MEKTLEENKMQFNKERAKKLRIIKLKADVKGYIFIMPVVLGLLLFTAFPVIYAFISSFFDVKAGELIFTNFGFQNYLKVFTDSYKSFMFLKSLEVTFTYAIINIPLTLVLSFSLALFLNQKVKGMNFFRVLYYMPVLIPAVCGGLVWKNILNVDYGIANKILGAIGFSGKFTWLEDPSTAMFSFIFTGLFGLGGGMILWLAQLKNVPTTFYESARLDGAGWWKQLFSITIPMCTPMIFYNLVLSLIATLQTFAQVQVLTNGAGPKYSLLFYIMNVYEEAFTGHDLGFSSALSFILLIIIGAFTLVIFKTGGWVYYGEDD